MSEKLGIVTDCQLIISINICTFKRITIKSGCFLDVAEKLCVVHKTYLAVPRGHVHSKISNIKNIEINLHYVKPEHHEIGKMISEDGLPCYDLERTICDFFKNHSRFSYRWLREIARNYNRDNRCNPDKLLEYREQLNLSQLAKIKMDWLIFRDKEARKKLFPKDLKNLWGIVCHSL